MKFLKVKKNLPEIILLVIFFFFSWWLMWHTFNYKDGVILIAAKAWSDFGASIPLIRSFSWGKNWPPEYPLFPGEPIKYHFLFYLLVGMLEKIGLPLSWALNLPSLLGFFGLLVIIYKLACLLFERKSVALLAVIFFLFNSSLSFLEFFKKYPLSRQTPIQIISNKSFPSFGPYDGKTISAFWNLNIYTNQRHLATSYFLLLFIGYILLKAVKTGHLNLRLATFLGLLIGLLPFFHKAVFLMAGIILAGFLVFFPKFRKQLLFISFIAAFLTIPQLAIQAKTAIGAVSFHPGYLVSWPLTFKKIVSYWYLNLGLSLVLIPVGFLLANNTAKKLFLTILPLFLIGNLFQFSPEIAGNHKFFNFFIIIGSLFSAWAIYSLWQRKILGKILAPIFIFLMIFSGLIDFFPVKNDFMYALNDAPKNPDIAWIKNNTPPDAIFLNSSFLYHPASLAGRKIFSGWPYFTWGVGYDSSTRDKTREHLLNPPDLKTFCQNARNNNLSYLIINKNEKMADIDLVLNKVFFEQNLIRVYENQKSGYIIYSISKSCPADYD